MAAVLTCSFQVFYMSGKTGKSLGICVVRENIIFEKSGKMIFYHANCR